MKTVEQTGGQQVMERQSYVSPQMSVGSWIITFLLLAIPLLNIILIFIWAFDPASQRRNFARAYLIISIIMIILSTLAVISLGAFSGVLNSLL